MERLYFDTKTIWVFKPVSSMYQGLLAEVRTIQ